MHANTNGLRLTPLKNQVIDNFLDFFACLLYSCSEVSLERVQQQLASIVVDHFLWYPRSIVEMP